MHGGDRAADDQYETSHRQRRKTPDGKAGPGAASCFAPDQPARAPAAATRALAITPPRPGCAAYPRPRGRLRGTPGAGHGRYGRSLEDGEQTGDPVVVLAPAGMRLVELRRVQNERGGPKPGEGSCEHVVPESQPPYMSRSGHSSGTAADHEIDLAIDGRGQKCRWVVETSLSGRYDEASASSKARETVLRRWKTYSPNPVMRREHPRPSPIPRTASHSPPPKRWSSPQPPRDRRHGNRCSRQRPR